jgi:hypothetical protein
MINDTDRSKIDQYRLYLLQLSDELSFLWKEAQSTEVFEIKERKLSQFWEMYRFYRKQKEFVKLMFLETI